MDDFINGRVTNIFSWAAAVLMVAANVALIEQVATGGSVSATTRRVPQLRHQCERLLQKP